MNLGTCTITTVAFVFCCYWCGQWLLLSAIVIDDDAAFVAVVAAATATFVFIKTKTDVDSKARAPAQD